MCIRDREYTDHLRNIICVYDKWQRVRNYMTRFKLTTRVPTADDCFAHYKECVWLDPNCKAGPDTCVCSYISGECYNLIQLLDRVLKEEEAEYESRITEGSIENKQHELYERLR